MQLQDAGHSANSLKYIFQTSVCEYKITNIKIRHFNTSNFLFSQVYKPQVLKLSEKWHPFLQNYFTLSTTPNSKLHLLLLHIPSHPTSRFPCSLHGTDTVLTAPLSATFVSLFPWLPSILCWNVTFSEPYSNRRI